MQNIIFMLGNYCRVGSTLNITTERCVENSDVSEAQGGGGLGSGRRRKLLVMDHLISEKLRKSNTVQKTALSKFLQSSQTRIPAYVGAYSKLK